MVIRIFRARVREGSQAKWVEKVEQLTIPYVKSFDGLLACYLAKPLDPITNEFVMVTLWKDTAALKDFTGGDWTRAVVAGDELTLVEDTDVDNYEVISEYALATDG